MLKRKKLIILSNARGAAIQARAAMLKKSAAVLAAILFSLSPLSAQKTQIGLNLGLSRAFFTGPPDLIFEQNNLMAYRAGIWIDHAFGEHFSIQSGLEYWDKGFDGSLRSFGMLTVITPVRLRIQYLELPLVLRYHLGRYLFFGAGPYLAQKLGGQLTLFRDESARLKPREIGYILGIGAAIHLFRQDHTLELQWRKGWTPVFSINEDDFFFSTLSILYGLRF